MKKTLLASLLVMLFLNSEIVLAENKGAGAQLQDLKNNAVKIAAEKTTEKNDLVASPKQLATNGFADLIEELMPAVVNISTVQEVSAGNNLVIDEILLGDFPKTPIFEDLRRQLEKQLRGSEQRKKLSSIGSGFVVSKDGFIVTNNHVIDEASEITVSMNDGLKYKAKVVGVDKKTDLALLKINPNKELKFLRFGDSNKSRIGDWVIVIGNPYGLGGSVSVGIVSARGRDINNGQSDEFIQTDAAINKGNSGGPMLNIKGEVIGINAAIFSPSGGSVGIGFAIPSSTASQVTKQLREDGEVVRGWIGVSIQDISDEIAESIKLDKNKGAFVVDVTADGPAQKAGILPTDVILKFDDQEIDDMKMLPKIVSKYRVGKVAKVTILRQGKVKVLKVTVEKMRGDESKKLDSKIVEKKQVVKSSGQLLGLSIGEFRSKIKKDNKEITVEGLLVVDVNPKSEAAEKGVTIGDVILSVNQAPVTSTKEMKKIIEDAAKINKKLFLFIKRGEGNFAVVLSSD